MQEVTSLGRRLKLLSERIANRKEPKIPEFKPGLLQNIEEEKFEFKPKSYDGHKLSDSKLEFDEDLFEICRVEGYDDTSYITSLLKDIRREMANNEFAAVGQKINKIIDDVMPFDYQQFFELFEATEQTALRLRGKVCWVLLGPTGAGKSTSIHFLCGSTFSSDNGEDVVVKRAHASLADKDITVGQCVTESQTRYISEVSLDLNLYKDKISFDRDDPKQILCVDSPGFEDTAGPEVNMANGIGTIRALKQAKAVKIIITFKEAHLDYRFKIIRSIANNMGKAVNGLTHLLDKKHGSPISGFLTKSFCGIKSAQAKFSKAYDEQERKEQSSSDDVLFKALIYKLGKKGPLNEIKIDLENPKNNERQRIEIIKSLASNTGYIQAPKQTFSEFISESTLSRLKQQIERSYNTIENILDHDEYFEQPKYIRYIVHILNNIDKLKGIIRTAGGKFVESRLRDCMDLFKAKWNQKIAKADDILTNMELKECSIRSMAKRLREFGKINDMMKENAKVIKLKYYKELKDVNCLNDGLRSCFDELYRSVADYLNTMKQESKSDDNISDTDVEDPLSPLANAAKLQFPIEDNVINNVYDDGSYDKRILLSIQKCCLLKQYKKDKYIRKKFKEFDKLVDEILKALERNCKNLMHKKEALNASNVPIFMFIYSSLSKLHNILMAKESDLSKTSVQNLISATTLTRDTSDYAEHLDDEYDEYKDESSQAIKIIQRSIDKLKKNLQEMIKHICKSYSLKVMSAIAMNSDDNNANYVDMDAILRSKVIRTDDQMIKRETNLTSFCLWITQLNDALSNTDVFELSIFINLQIWLNRTKDQWISWLSGACINELTKCNDLLIEKQAESWNDVEKLLNECKSLRKVEAVANNTSQEFFRTLSEFDFSKAALAKQVVDLMKEINNDETNIDYDRIIKIANQLYSAGCSNESSEMKQIYNKLNQHLKNLKSKTDAFVLSVDSADDLAKIQNTMNELDTIQRFADFMPDIKNEANECYTILKRQVIEILDEIHKIYDLAKCSTEINRDLKAKLKSYLNIKNTIDVKILNEIIAQCLNPSLARLVDENEDKINKLRDRNEEIKQIMVQKGGAIMKEIEKFAKMHKKGKSILMNLGVDDLDEYLNTIGFKNLKQIKSKLDKLKQESESICGKEQEEEKQNKNEIKTLISINDEIEKCVEIENDLLSLNIRRDTIIEYRRNSSFLQNDICELEALLDGNPSYLFTQRLSLQDAHNALQFLHKCKEIRWNKMVLSSKYITAINENVTNYLKAYGEHLETNLNNLLRSLAITDLSKCDLNDAVYRKSVTKAISKLNDCLREFRDISSFDLQMKMQIEDMYDVNEKQPKQLKLVTRLFTNHDIQLSVDKYINTTISIHKHDILINLDQWKAERPETLPILHFICLSMSSLDRYISSSKHEQTYYRMATQIDGELSKFSDENTRQIIPLFENKHWDQLREILETLQRTANVKKKGAAEKSYHNAVMKLFCALNKLMAETKTKLLIDINKDNDLNDEKILALNDGLKAVRNLVETIAPHLKNKAEKDRVKKAEEDLGLLLANRLTLVMQAAITSIKRRAFKQCEKRLDNVSKLMEHTDMQCYIPAAAETKTDDDNNTKKKAYNNSIVVEYNNTRDRITAELDTIKAQVKEANDALENLSSFNPYNKLKLIRLHSQLVKSENEQFAVLWDNISDDILSTISGIFTQIRERNNKIQMQNEYDVGSRDAKTKIMTYQQQTEYLQKIKQSLSLFPAGMKQTVKDLLVETQQVADGNVQYIEDGFEKSVEANAWNETARSLNGFQDNNPTLFHKSRQMIVTKSNNIYKEFNANMKTTKGFQDNLNELSLYKTIALSFTSIKYDDANDNHSNIVIAHVDTTMKQIYNDIENKFMNECKDIKASLTGRKSWDVLKDGFFIAIQVLERKDNLPTHTARSVMNESRELFKPIQKLVNTLKTRKNQGLDRNNHDIDPLIGVLDHIKSLTDVDFHSNMRIFLPLIDKKGQNKLKKIIENIEYDNTVKETKDMLTEYKESVSTEGLNKEKIQQNQAKRLSYLKQLALKMKALMKSASCDICEKHLEIKQSDFEKTYIKPCTNKMRADIKQMQKETNNAFTKQVLDTRDLVRANANMEAFHAVKNVFEKQIDDDRLSQEIKVDQAIEKCQETATDKVNQLTKQIQNTGIDKEHIDVYMEQCAKSLINLEYLNKHINFKTSLRKNGNDARDENELHQHIQSAIKGSMNFLTKEKNTKKKMNVLYNHLIDTDANYGTVFTQQQSVFKSSLAKAMNQQFRELDVLALVKNLKMSEKNLKSKHKKLIGIDWDKIGNTFQDMLDKYNDLVMTNLRSAKSFDELKQDNIPRLAEDAKRIANKAVRSKNNWFTQKCSSGFKYAADTVSSLQSWFKGIKSKNNDADDIRNGYWTPEIMQAVIDIVPYILAIWTLSSASCYYESDDKNVLMKARNAQIVAICCLLCLDIDQRHKLINNLVEIGTGEGKSVIMAITSIALALLDFDVYCACYSELLSKRDEDAFNDLFLLFGVHEHIHYQTFNNIFEQVINDGGDIRESTRNIVLGKDLQSQNNDDCKTDETVKQLLKRQKILFIDEVDKFFSTDFFGKQYTPSCIIPKQEMKTLLLFVWDQYVANDCNGNSITIQMIEQSTECQALFGAFAAEWNDLLKESIKDIIDGIRTFKDDTYKLKNGRNICYKFSDTYSSKVFYGYRTIFAYLHELNNGNITDELYVHRKLTWFLKCGSFSYSEIPNDFYAILGVTGTLNSLSPKEHQVMQKSYGIKKYVVMPSLFDKKNKLDYAVNKDIGVLTPDYFYNQLHSTIQEYQNNDIAAIKRPIIVFFKNENKLNYFYNLEVCKTWRINDVIQKLTPDLSDHEKHTGILNATKANMITFATEEYGRGIDFKVFDKQLDVKGMHVELTYWTETLAEEIQIKGRTARQGKKGSFHIILNEDEMMDQCSVSAEDIQKHQDDGNLYEWLNEIRNRVFAKQYDEASNYVKELKPIHKQSEELAASLRKKDVQTAKAKLLLFNKGANIQSAAKLSILIDSTGSMYSCLNQCKIVIQKTIPKLVEFLIKNGINAESFEIQIIGYRNYNAGSDDILEFCPFTSKENDLSQFVQTLSPAYGWGAEAIEVAFKQLNRQKKKPNIVLLMADAPAHTKAEMQNKRQQRYGEQYWQSERDGMFANTTDWKEESEKFINENGDAQIFCFYLTDWAKDNFNKIAQIGKGKSIPLNVNNEKQSINLLQSALSETILLKMNNGSMEYVEKFRKQNKNMPTFL